MGNTPAKETIKPTPPPEAARDSNIVTPDDSYNWPSNLYEETRDMAAASFLVYTFGLMLDVARSQPNGLVGLELNKDGQVSKQSTTRRLHRTFTPQEVKNIVDNPDNRALLIGRYPKVFTGYYSTLLDKSLTVMQQRANDSGMDRPLTLIEFDDKHQDQEMVYGVAKNDIDKRITLIFRGTDNNLAMYSNWLTNAYVTKTQADNLVGPVKDEDIWFHKGFYNYIFDKTVETKDAPDKRKYDEILEDIKPLLKANPDYKLYVTGHSLGGALASIVAFYLACEEDIQLPVTCISFASPRVGDYGFRKATNMLEQAKRLRVLRVINENDTVAVMPMVNYKHAGWQIRLYKSSSAEPDITYPKLVSSYWNMFKGAWDNSVVASFNFGYDHGDYRERIDDADNQAFLKQQDLNALYNDADRAGFSWGK